MIMSRWCEINMRIHMIGTRTIRTAHNLSMKSTHMMQLRVLKIPFG